jgi:putative hemolysin
MDTSASFLRQPGPVQPAGSRAAHARSAASARDAASPRLLAQWARHEDEVREAQRLRFQVFGQEMGARLATPEGTPPGLDVDRFDAFCEHLLIRTTGGAEVAGEVVGTYRVLTPAGARQAGGLYSDTEFDLAPLDRLRPRIAELGRSCTAPGWRKGGVILMLWSSLAEFMQRNGLDVMMGCASVPMHDGGHAAASLWRRLREQHLVEESLRVQPRLALPVEQLDQSLPVDPPPLIKGYLRCAARVLGAPAWDPDFGVADLPLLLDTTQLSSSYRDRFLRA